MGGLTSLGMAFRPPSQHNCSDGVPFGYPLTTQKHDAPAGGIQRPDSRAVGPSPDRADSVCREPKV